MEDLGITKEQANELVEKYIKEPMTILHLLESEAIMRELARHLGEDEEKWGIIGLLHDIDWDLTKNTHEQHCIKAQELLHQAGASEFLIETIISHGYDNETIPSLKDKKRKTTIQHCLVAAETLTGIIVACAVRRHGLSVGANPTRQLSLQPVAIGAGVEATRRLKPPM